MSEADEILGFDEFLRILYLGAQKCFLVFNMVCNFMQDGLDGFLCKMSLG